MNALFVRIRVEDDLALPGGKIPRPCDERFTQPWL
jgi:hypothetical protein